MKRNRKIGYMLMLIALLAPIYMFGSMAVKSLTRTTGYNSYTENISLLNNENWNKIASQIEKYNSKLQDGNATIVDPFGTEGYESKYNISNDDKDFILGYVNIPKINIKYPLRLGTTDEVIRNGMGHVDNTSLPDSGKNTRSVIASHRVTATDLMLFEADTIGEGDELILDLGYKVIVYKYKDTKIIDPSDWEALLPEENLEMITVLTCDPPYPPFPRRMLINFVKDKEYLSRNLVEENNQNGVKRLSISENTEVVSREEMNGLFTNTQSSQVKIIDIVISAVFVLLVILFVYILVKFIKKLKKERKSL